MIIRMRWAIAMLSVAIGTLATGARGADPEVATACGDGRHVFLVRPGVEEQVWEIAHIDASATPLAIRSIVSFARRPEAIASSGDRCWVLLPAVDATRAEWGRGVRRAGSARADDDAPPRHAPIATGGAGADEAARAVGADREGEAARTRRAARRGGAARGAEARVEGVASIPRTASARARVSRPMAPNAR